MDDKDILRSIADNQPLFEALKKLLKQQFEQTPRTDDAISDAQLGQMYRARLIGLEKIDQAFREIAVYKSNPDTPRKVNRGR